jgi:hypothetical protein
MYFILFFFARISDNLAKDVLADRLFQSNFVHLSIFIIMNIEQLHTVLFVIFLHKLLKELYQVVVLEIIKPLLALRIVQLTNVIKRHPRRKECQHI